jgi:hypothetical protein
VTGRPARAGATCASGGAGVKSTVSGEASSVDGLGLGPSTSWIHGVTAHAANGLDGNRVERFGLVSGTKQFGFGLVVPARKSFKSTKQV